MTSKSDTVHRTPIQQIVSFGKKETLKSGRRIEVDTVSWEEFDAIRDCPVQRNHEARAKDPKFQEKLKNLIPPNVVGYSCLLTEKAEDPTILDNEGKTKVWPKGTEFLTDIHTRREYWRKYSSSRPAEIMLIRSFVPTMGDIREQYYAHDNSRNVERGSDLAYGAVRGLGYGFKTNRMYKVMPFTWASYYMDPKTFEKNSGFDGAKFSLTYSETYFKNEALFLDSLTFDKTITKAQGSLLCASLLFLKKANINGDIVLAQDIVKRLFAYDPTGKDKDGLWDGVTQALRWIVDPKLPKETWNTNWNTMNNLVGNFIYWMNQALSEQKRDKKRLKKPHYSNPDSTVIPDEITDIRDLFLPWKVSPRLPV
jgi:hypothetical protein